MGPGTTAKRGPAELRTLGQDRGLLRPSSAARLPRARWLDTRLLLGLLLVLCSVVAGARLFAAADDTVPVWTAAADLGPGVPLGPADVVPRQVRLVGGAEHYLSASGPVPAGLVLTRPVGRGELLPAGAVAPAGSMDLRRVPVEAERLAGLGRGAVVDVYALPAATQGQPPGAAQLVLPQLTVAEVEEPGRALGAPRGRGVVLLVPGPEVRRLLDAHAGGRLALVQVPSTSSSGQR